MSGISRSAAVVTGFAAIGLAIWIADGGVLDWQAAEPGVSDAGRLGRFAVPVAIVTLLAAGAAAGIFAFASLQVRKLRLMKAETRAHAGLLQALGDTLQDMVLIADGHGVCRRVIARGGRDVLDMLRPHADTDLARLLPEGLAGPVMEAVRGAIGSWTAVAFQWTCSEGGAFAGRSFDVRATPLPNARTGAEPTALVLLHELSDVRRAERALRICEGRLNAILDNAPAHVYLKDLDGRYTMVGRGFMERAGLAEGDILGKTVADVFPGERPDYSDELDRKVRATGKTQVGELELFDGQGEIQYCALLTKFPVWDGQGKLAGTGGISVDITDIKRLQSELRSAKEKADTANTAKSAFLANMSHELRTPLNSIIGFSDILAEELMGPLGHEKYREYASDVRQSGQDLLQLINDILDISRIEAGGMVLREDAVHIPLLLSQCERIMAPRFHEVQVDLRMEAEPGLRPLRADEHRVKQVVFNLLSNAVKFTPPGGRVVVNARTEPDGRTAFVVSDTGVGMSSGDIDKAVSMFGQFGDAMTRRHDGAGLGLSLSKKIVELHGGVLSIASEKGHGTAVTIEFPAERTV